MLGCRHVQPMSAQHGERQGLNICSSSIRRDEHRAHRAFPNDTRLAILGMAAAGWGETHLDIEYSVSVHCQTTTHTQAWHETHLVLVQAPASRAAAAARSPPRN
eukprot:1983604-Rhodomonas_salina.1